MNWHKRETADMEATMNSIKVLTIACSIALLSGCIGDEWDGYVYPDSNDLTVHRHVGTFSSLESCRDAALSTLENMGALRSGDYECGLNCEARSNLGGMKVCDKTEQ